jgi:hypothetical protein
MSFITTNITPMINLTNKDWKYINAAADIAEKSRFDSSKRLGACIIGKGSCLLCR